MADHLNVAVHKIPADVDGLAVPRCFTEHTDLTIVTERVADALTPSSNAFFKFFLRFSRSSNGFRPFEPVFIAPLLEIVLKKSVCEFLLHLCNAPRYDVGRF